MEAMMIDGLGWGGGLSYGDMWLGSVQCVVLVL